MNENINSLITLAGCLPNNWKLTATPHKAENSNSMITVAAGTALPMTQNSNSMTKQLLAQPVW